MAYNLTFNGYYRDEVRKQFPEIAGIYCVYRGVYNPQTKWITLMELLYIGQTGNLHQRHNEHEKREEFLSHLLTGEMLVYNYALTDCSENERKRIESALIYELHPTLNEASTISFDYPGTEVSIQGDRHAYLPNYLKAPSY